MDSPEVREAFRRYVESGAWGEVDTSSLGRVWRRACAKVERELRKKAPHIKLPHMSQKVLRHSFGTQVFNDTHGNQTVTAEMLGLAPGSPMVRRYTLGAVPSVLRTAMKNFRPKKSPKKARKRSRVA